MKKFACLLLSAVVLMQASAQTDIGDSAEAIKAFLRVTSLSRRPNLYYKAYTTITSSPILQPEDTISFGGEFIKSDSGIYVKNGEDETFQQNGYVVQINNTSKNIAVERWEQTQNPPGIMPFDSITLARMLQNNYRMTLERATKKNTSTIHMLKNVSQLDGEINSEILISFNTTTYLPNEIVVKISLKKKASQKEIQELINNGISTAGLIKSDGNEKFFIREQQIRTVFEEVSDREEKVKNMPKWKDKLNKVNNGFITKGTVKGYHVEAN